MKYLLKRLTYLALALILLVSLGLFSACDLHQEGGSPASDTAAHPASDTASRSAAAHGQRVTSDVPADLAGAGLVVPYEKGRGNSSGNLANNGRFAQEGEWIYYSEYADNYKLYKMKLDGTERSALSEFPVREINVRDGWVYFVQYRFYVEGSSISRMRVDGSEVESLLDADFIYSLILEEDWLYYNDMSACNRMKTDGSARQTISAENGADARYWTSDTSYSSTVYQSYLYCLQKDDFGTSSLVRIQADTGEREVLFPFEPRISSLQVHGDKLYFVDREHLAEVYACDLDGTNLTQVYQTPKYELPQDYDTIQSLLVTDQACYVSLSYNSDFNVNFTRLLRMDSNWEYAEVIAESSRILTPFEINGQIVFYQSQVDGAQLEGDSETVFLSGNCFERYGEFIAEHDGWVYFIARDADDPIAAMPLSYYLMRSRADGSQREMLSPSSFPVKATNKEYVLDNIWLDIDSGRLYYPSASDEPGFCSVTLSGQDPQTHLSSLAPGQAYAIYDGWVYYQDEAKSFVRVRIDGKGLETLYPEPCSARINIDKNFMSVNLYIEGASVQNFALTESGRFVLLEEGLQRILSVTGEKVIYHTYESESRIMIYDAIKGSANVSPVPTSGLITGYGEWLYSRGDFDESEAAYDGIWRVRYDGRQKTKIADHFFTSLPSFSIVDQHYLYTEQYDIETETLHFDKIDVETGQKKSVGPPLLGVEDYYYKVIDSHIFVHTLRVEGIYAIAAQDKTAARLVGPIS